MKWKIVKVVEAPTILAAIKREKKVPPDQVMRIFKEEQTVNTEAIGFLAEETPDDEDYDV